MLRWNHKEHLALAGYSLKWTALVVPLALATGALVALFLWALDRATQTRFSLPWLIWLMPLAGVAIAWAYRSFGGRSAAGNNLILDEIHQEGGGVPLRMTPLILVSTVVAHLFGASVGREGTAVQMGGSVASGFCRATGLGRREARVLLMAGMAAGFGAVFGTPLAGAVFAMEVLAIGTLEYEAILPCLVAAVLAERTSALLGSHHTDYHIGVLAQMSLGFDWALAGKACAAGALFGLVAALFASMIHGFSALSRERIPWWWLRPVVGAAVVLGLTLALGTRDYLGLGVAPQNPGGVGILTCFTPGGAPALAWFWKALFTALCLGFGFKGGEVTPLFFVGAALGNVLAAPLGIPVELAAAMGFVAVFGAATNTPIASILLGVELFGGGAVLYVALACVLAYLLSGRRGIYLSQRVGRSKGGLGGDGTLRDIWDSGAKG